MNEVPPPHLTEGIVRLKDWKGFAGSELRLDSQSNSFSLLFVTCIKKEINFKYDKPQKA